MTPAPTKPPVCPANDNINHVNKRSKGEELYLVHLQRINAFDPHPEDNDDDHDYPHPKKGNKTVGEELYCVHVKRSQGLEPDYDGDAVASEEVGGGPAGSGRGVKEEKCGVQEAEEADAKDAAGNKAQ